MANGLPTLDKLKKKELPSLDELKKKGGTEESTTTVTSESEVASTESKLQYPDQPTQEPVSTQTYLNTFKERSISEESILPEDINRQRVAEKAANLEEQRKQMFIVEESLKNNPELLKDEEFVNYAQRLINTYDKDLAEEIDWSPEDKKESSFGVPVQGIDPSLKLFMKAIGHGAEQSVESLASGLKWAGMDNASVSVRNFAQQNLPKEVNEAFSQMEDFSYTDMLGTDFWVTRFPQMIGNMLPMLATAIPGAVAGGAVATGLGLGSIGRLVVTGIGGSLTQTPVESLIEAGGAYEQLVGEVGEEKAAIAAKEVFWKNMALGSVLNAAQVGFAFAKMPAKFAKIVPGKVGTVVVLGSEMSTESAQELWQEWTAFNAVQVGLGKPTMTLEEFKKTPEGKLAMTGGAVLGGGMTIAGKVFGKGTTKEDAQAQILDSFVQNGNRDGLQRALDGNIANGSMTQEDADVVLKDYDSMVEADPQVPKDIPQRSLIVAKVAKKKELEELRGEVDDAFLPDIDKQIEKLNTEIQDLSKEKAEAEEFDGRREMHRKKLQGKIDEGTELTEVEADLKKSLEEGGIEFTEKVEVKEDVKEEVITEKEGTPEKEDKSHMVSYGKDEDGYFKTVDGEKTAITEATYNFETERMKDQLGDVDVTEEHPTKKETGGKGTIWGKEEKAESKVAQPKEAPVVKEEVVEEKVSEVKEKVSAVVEEKVEEKLKDVKPEKIIDLTKQKESKNKFQKNINKKYGGIEVSTPRTGILQFFALGGKLNKKDAIARTGHKAEDLFGWVSDKGVSYESLIQQIKDEYKGEEFDEVALANEIDEIIRSSKKDVFAELNEVIEGEKDESYEEAFYEETSQLEDQEGYLEQEESYYEQLTQDEQQELNEVIESYTENNITNWQKIQDDIDKFTPEILNLVTNAQTKLEELTKAALEQSTEKGKRGTPTEDVGKEKPTEEVELYPKHREEWNLAKPILKEWLEIRNKIDQETDEGRIKKLKEEEKGIENRYNEFKPSQFLMELVNATVMRKAEKLRDSAEMEAIQEEQGMIDAEEIPENSSRYFGDQFTNIITKLYNELAITPESKEESVEIKGKDRIAKGLDNLSSAIGAKKEIIGDQRQKVVDALVEIGKGLIEAGLATAENVYEKIRDAVKGKIAKADIDSLENDVVNKFKSKVEGLEEKLETGKKEKSDYIKRRVKDLRDTPQFIEEVNEFGDYQVQSKELANIESEKLIKDLQKEFGKKEGLQKAFELVKSLELPDIMFGPITAKIDVKMKGLGMIDERLEVLDYKQKDLRKSARKMASVTSDASPEETVSRIFAGLDKEKTEALNKEFKEGETYKAALEKVKKRLDEVEKAYKELKESGEISEENLPEPEGKTKRSRELKERSRKLRRDGIALLKKGLKKQGGTLSMGLQIESDTFKGLTMIFQSYLLEFEGNILQAFEKFKKDTVKEYEVTEEQIDNFKKDLINQSEEVINEFREEKKVQIVENILKPDIKETPEQTKTRKETAKQMVEDHSEGKDLSEGLSEIAGFEQISNEDANEILQLTDEFSQYLVEGKTELANNAWEDLMIKLGDLKLVSRAKSEVILSIWYPAVLSGLTTIARSIKGSGTTALFFNAFRLMSSPKAAPLMIAQMAKGGIGIEGKIPIGSRLLRMAKNYLHVVRTGQTRVNVTDFTPKLPAVTDVLVKKSFAELSAKMKAAKVVATPFIYAYRNILAWDQILGNVSIEGNMALYEMDRTDKSKKAWQRREDARKALAEDDRSKSIEQAEEEIADMKESGEEIPLGYKDRRVREIMNSKRDYELVKRAVYDASVANVVSVPKGTLGSVYNLWLKAIDIKKEDRHGATAFKLFAKSIFPFMRIAFNWMNAGLDYTAIGAVRSIKKGTWTKDGYKDLHPYERRELRLKSAVGTVVAGTILASMFKIPWDEDEGWEINPDTWIQVHGALTGKWWEHKDVASDAQPYSIRVKNPFTGEWSDYYKYRDNPIGFVLAPIGLMYDEILFQDFKKDVTGEEKANQIKKIKYSLSALAQGTLRYSMDQSFNQGMKTLSMLANPESQEKFGKSLEGVLVRPSTGFYPGLYKQLYQQYRALSDTPEKESKTWYEKPAKMIPIVDGIIKNDKYDVFGYPIIRDFDFPLIPDIILKMAKENLDYREDYEEWQLLWKYEEVTIGGFLSPKIISGHVLTSSESDLYMRTAGGRMRSLVNKNYKKLNSYDPKKLQINLTKYKREAAKYAKENLPMAWK